MKNATETNTTATSNVDAILSQLSDADRAAFKAALGIRAVPETMTAEIDEQGMLVIRIPFDNRRIDENISAGGEGKMYMHASSRGMKPTNLLIDGQQVRISVLAGTYINRK